MQQIVLLLLIIGFAKASNDEPDKELYFVNYEFSQIYKNMPTLFEYLLNALEERPEILEINDVSLIQENIGIYANHEDIVETSEQNDMERQKRFTESKQVDDKEITEISTNNYEKLQVTRLKPTYEYVTSLVLQDANSYDCDIDQINYVDKDTIKDKDIDTEDTTSIKIKSMAAEDDTERNKFKVTFEGHDSDNKGSNVGPKENVNKSFEFNNPEGTNVFKTSEDSIETNMPEVAYEDQDYNMLDILSENGNRLDEDTVWNNNKGFIGYPTFFALGLRPEDIEQNILIAEELLESYNNDKVN